MIKEVDGFQDGIVKINGPLKVGFDNSKIDLLILCLVNDNTMSI